MLKKFLILGVLCSALVFNSNGQSKRPSEARKERQEQASTNKVFNDNDKYFSVKDVPEKWKNESGVILASSHKYEYTADGSLLNFVETTRKKIKLQDKAAIEEFSKFYFYKTGDNYKVGIRVIKADGSTKNISTNDAIKVTNDIPGFFLSSIRGFKVEYNKVAIPDLEPGDMIDFFQEVHGYGINFTGSAQALSPIFFTLDDEYPILKQKYDFIAEKGYFINFKSMNGAPELKKNPNPDRRLFSFSMEDSDRERVKDIRWLYTMRKLPSVKFQVCYAKIGSESEQFLGKVGEPVTSVTPQQIAEKVSYKYYDLLTTAKLWIDEIQPFMRKHHKDVKDPLEYLKISYYYLRHNTLLKYKSKGDYVGSDESIRDDAFVVIMSELLKELKTESKVVVSAPRSLSSIDDIVMYDEMMWALQVKGKYIYPFSANSNIYETDDDIESCDAYIITVNRREKDVKYEKVTLPASTAADNSIATIYDVKLDDELENMKISSEVVVKGLLKASNGYVLRHTDYIDNDYEIYGDEKPEEEVTRNKTKLAEIERKETARQEEQKKDKIEQMKKSMEDDFKNIVSYDNFTLLETGRSSDKPEIKYTEKFVLGDLVKKAGPNYSVDLGSLVGSQVDIKAKEKERDYDVFINFPKTILYTINFTIPAGYKAEGLEALKFNVDNNTGSFIASTSQTGDVLTVTAKKVYKTNFVKKEDWGKMVEFLDAAFNFSNKKIIVKKK